MTERIYRLSKREEFAEAGPGDLIELLPAPGNTPMTLQKSKLEIVGHGIRSGEFIHLHGDTGTGKTALLDAFTLVPGNWRALCGGLGLSYKPLRVFAIEMVHYETPGELYTRRAIREGRTYDEESDVIASLREAATLLGSHDCLMWLRELGRVHSASVQGGLLNLIGRGMIRLPDGQFIGGTGIAWVADSNYNVEETATYTLVTLDDALARRATVSIPFGYLLPEEEIRILRHFAREGRLPPLDEALAVKVVELGQAIRTQRRQGSLLSVAPPTLSGYFAFLRIAHALPALSVQEVANVTLMGSASPSDREQLAGVFSEVFGVRKGPREDTLMGGELF